MKWLGAAVLVCLAGDARADGFDERLVEAIAELELRCMRLSS